MLLFIPYRSIQLSACYQISVSVQYVAGRRRSLAKPCTAQAVIFIENLVTFGYKFGNIPPVFTQNQKKKIADPAGGVRSEAAYR